MPRKARSVVFLCALGTVPLGLGCAGSGEARYVYQDGEYGVIGIPKNTTRWPHNYRKQAEHLMAAHFPEGYEIVRAEEVKEGDRILDDNGKLTSNYEPGLHFPTAFLKLGKREREDERKRHDTIKIMESRIIYKRLNPGDGAQPGSYAALASSSPALYVDPNATERRLEAESQRLAKSDPAVARKGTDPEVKRTSDDQ